MKKGDEEEELDQQGASRTLYYLTRPDSLTDSRRS